MYICIAAEGAKNVSWPGLSLLRGWANLTTKFTGKFVCMTHHFILLEPNRFGLGDGGLNAVS